MHSYFGAYTRLAAYAAPDFRISGHARSLSKVLSFQRAALHVLAVPAAAPPAAPVVEVSDRDPTSALNPVSWRCVQKAWPCARTSRSSEGGWAAYSPRYNDPRRPLGLRRADEWVGECNTCIKSCMPLSAHPSRDVKTEKVPANMQMLC